MSALRAVLDAVLHARPGTGLDDIARRLDLSRDEVEAMVEYWARRGVLTVQWLRGCPGGACGTRPAAQAAGGGSTHPAAGAAAGCPATGGGCPLGGPPGPGSSPLGGPVSGPLGGLAGDDAPALLVIGKFQNRS